MRGRGGKKDKFLCAFVLLERCWSKAEFEIQIFQHFLHHARLQRIPMFRLGFLRACLAQRRGPCRVYFQSSFLTLRRTGSKPAADVFRKLMSSTVTKETRPTPRRAHPSLYLVPFSIIGLSGSIVSRSRPGTAHVLLGTSWVSCPPQAREQDKQVGPTPKGVDHAKMN